MLELIVNNYNNNNNIKKKNLYSYSKYIPRKNTTYNSNDNKSIHTYYEA